jgi:hypothetical protein
VSILPGVGLDQVSKPTVQQNCGRPVAHFEDHFPALVWALRLQGRREALAWCTRSLIFFGVIHGTNPALEKTFIGIVFWHVE